MRTLMALSLLAWSVIVYGLWCSSRPHETQKWRQLDGLLYCESQFKCTYEMELPPERGLPHRPLNELTNWGQGRAPESNRCPPGTIRFDTDDGLFLECYRTSQP